MNQLTAIAVSTATLAVVLNGGAAMANGGQSSGTWPAALPLPSPSRLISQSSTTAVLRSTDSVAVVMSKLQVLYVTQKGCTRRLAVNKPRDYLCHNPATGKTGEVFFTFAALDPTATDPSRSQTNAFYAKN
jgi:hypothetical protein